MRKSGVTFLFLLIQLPIFFCQTETNYNGLIEYPLRKSVNNQYDSHLYKRFYEESLKTFEQTKNKLIEYVLSQEHTKRYIANNPSYVQTFIESLNDVNVLHNALMYSGIHLNIDGVDFYSSDTSIFRKRYEKSLENETNLRSSVSWSIYEFKTIPKTRAISYERPIVIRIGKGSLENGNYVMYYDPIYDSKTHKFRDKVPYCFFSIVEEKPHGHALFFTHTGDTLAYGQYLDGVQNGKWIIKLPFSSVKNSMNINYSPLNLDGEVVFSNEFKEIEFGWCSYEIEFVRGILDGSFHFKTNGITRSVGTMQQNKPIGLWKLYYSNGNLANSFELREYPKMLSNNFVYLPIANNTCINFSKGHSSVECLPMGNNKSSLIGLNTDFFEKFVEQIRDSISSSDYDNSFDFFKLKPNEFEFHSFESNQKILFVNWFEMYHENGQLLFKMHFSESGELTHYSSLFDENGKIYVKIQMNKDRTKAIYKYQTEGKTKRIKCRIINGERICR